jgi:hypothetical protein
MITDWPPAVWFLDLLTKAFPPTRMGHIAEDPDVLGFYWEWDDKDGSVKVTSVRANELYLDVWTDWAAGEVDFVWDDIDHIEEMREVHE